MTGVYTVTAKTKGSASLVIAAPPPILWKIVSDPPGMGRFSPENQGARWRDGVVKPEVGARFRGFNRRGPIFWYTECVVTACDRNRRFAFDVTFPPVFPLVAQWTWLLEPVERLGSTDSATRVSLAWQLPQQIDPARKFMWRAFGVRSRADDLTQGAARTLREIKGFVEPEGH